MERLNVTSWMSASPSSYPPNPRVVALKGSRCCLGGNDAIDHKYKGFASMVEISAGCLVLGVHLRKGWDTKTSSTNHRHSEQQRDEESRQPPRFSYPPSERFIPRGRPTLPCTK